MYTPYIYLKLLQITKHYNANALIQLSFFLSRHLLKGPMVVVTKQTFKTPKVVTIYFALHLYVFIHTHTYKI